MGMMVDDVKECANACDAYSKKKLLSKVVQSSRWDDVMQHFVKRFNKRRADIEFALAIHLGVNIDIAHRKLDQLDYKYVDSLTSPMITFNHPLSESTKFLRYFTKACLQSNGN